jgi:UDP:flavonoid glycosyltransferase YjiC (YdhE family)
MGAFPLFEASGGQVLSPPLEAFLSSGPRPVVVFPGSIAGAEGIALVRQSLTACRALGVRAVVLGLGESDWADATRGISTDTFLRCEHAPLSRLLPRTRVFIHHGGIGSCAQGLYQRVPQLIQPRAFDQFGNAEHVEREGGGRVVNAGAASRSRFLAVLEELGSGAAGAILDRTKGVVSSPGSTPTMPAVLDALGRWESRISARRS